LDFPSKKGGSAWFFTVGFNFHQPGVPGLARVSRDHSEAAKPGSTWGCWLTTGPHASAILPHGRRSQTVNGMAHEASDQGGSEGRVSRSEVVCPCGVGVSFGSTLPCCLRATSAVEKTVDGVKEGEVRSEPA
jgi:hypothetical protein